MASIPRVGVLLAVLALSVPGASLAGSRDRAAPVTGWIDVTLEEISGHRVNPPRAARALALVSVAIDRGAAHGHRAVHGASAEVLAHLFPDRAVAFRERASGLAGNPAQLRRGQKIGAAVVARANRDDSDAAYTGTRPFGIGFWTEPPGVPGPLEPAAGQWRPWNIRRGSVYRPPPPPGPGDAGYDDAVMDVYETSLSLTPQQRAIALFWADGAGTETPAGHWNRIALDLVGTKPALSEGGRPELRAPQHRAGRRVHRLLGREVQARCGRPITAIRRTIDSSWSPVVPTPPFPSYVSGHSTTSGAASAVLAALFPRRARDLASMANEAALSRLYGGIHFSFDNDDGLVLGRSVGRAALTRYDG